MPGGGFGPRGWTTSDEGVAHIALEEGCVLHVYLDQAHLPTIGYGHLILDHEKFTTITRAEAVDLLRRDLGPKEEWVRAHVVAQTQGQWDALVSLCFNVGGACLLDVLGQKMNQGDYLAAARRFLLYRKAGGKVLANLEARRAKEFAMYLGRAPNSEDYRAVGLAPHA